MNLTSKIMKDYYTIKGFIDWCVKNDYTEWMGFYGKTDEMLKMYFDEIQEANDYISK